MTTSLYVWGNHHCSNKKGFRDIFHQFIVRHTSLPYPAYHCDKLLNLDVINKLSSNLRSWPAVLIIIFGDSNLSSNESILQILEYFNKIYQLFSTFPNYRIITCGVIPPRNPTFLQQTRIKSLNCHLQKLQQSYGGEFMSVAEILSYDDYSDSKTLSYQGNIKLARKLTQTLYNLSH